MIKFRIKQDNRNRDIYDLMSQLPDRVESIIDRVPRIVADQIREDVVRAAPDAIPGYPGMLRVLRYKVRGTDSAAGVTAASVSHYYHLRSRDVTRTVVYVHPKEIRGETDPGAEVLARVNPWTMNTLPYEPKKHEADLVSRRVSEREVSIIEQRRASDRRQGLDNELVALGKRLERKARPLIARKVVRDLAFEVLRYEFGLGGFPLIMHWRPAIRAARSRGIRGAMERMLRWYAVPGEQRWRRYEIAKEGRPSDVRRVQKFQDLVASTGAG